MTAACGCAVGRGNMSRCVKTFRAWKQEGRAEIFDAAMARVRQWIPEKADRMAKAAETPQRKTAVRKAAHRVKETRQPTGAAADSVRKHSNRAEVVEDRRVALKRFWPEARAAEMEEAVSNDSGLAGATNSEVSGGLRRWCERGSWGACPECGILQARPLHQQGITRKSTQPPTVAKSCCKRCSSRQEPYVPKA